MDRVKNINWRDVGVRALKTFVQAYVAAWVVTQEPFSKSGVVAGVAAGISATWNVVKDVIGW